MIKSSAKTLLTGFLGRMVDKPELAELTFKSSTFYFRNVSISLLLPSTASAMVKSKGSVTFMFSRLPGTRAIIWPRRSRTEASSVKLGL